jgi:PAS domain S-box-containing protein
VTHSTFDALIQQPKPILRKMINIGHNLTLIDDDDDDDDDDNTTMTSHAALHALPQQEEDDTEHNHVDKNVNVLPSSLMSNPFIYKLSRNSQRSFLITDPHQAANPIVYASPGFLRLTGYPISGVLGRNCRFMQGPETDPCAVAKIRLGVESGQPEVSVCLLNYREDGTTFWNQLIIHPIHNSADQITHYVGVQYEVSNYHSLIQNDEDNDAY